MANERFKGDANFKAGGVVGGYSSADAVGASDPTLIVLRIDPTTSRLLVDASISSYTGVTDGEAVDGDDTGTLMLGTDGANYQVLSVDSDGHLQVDMASVVPGTGATNLGKAEDAVHTSGDVGVMALAVRNDIVAALATDDGDYAPLQVNPVGSLYVTPGNLISVNNSTTTVLDADEVYTGTADDCHDYSSITVMLDSSHDSSASGMTFQFSVDGTNWDDIYAWTYTAADGARRFQFPVTGRYFRIVYTNDSTLQTHFRVQTILHSNAILTTIHRLGDDTDPDRSAQLMKTAIIAQAAGTGDFKPVQSTAAGNLKVSMQEISDGLDVGAGNADSETQRVILASDQNFIHLEDVQHTTGDAGIMALAVENEDQADLSTGDKDYTPLAVTKEGNMIVKQEGAIILGAGTDVVGKVRLVTATGDEVTEDTDNSINVTIVADDVGIGGGTAYTEDVATANPIVGSAIMMERDDQLAAVTPVEGDWIGLRGTEKGALWVALADASGDPVTSFGGGTEYTEDGASAGGETGKFVIAVRNDTPSALTTADGDYAGLTTGEYNDLWVSLATKIDNTNDSILVYANTVKDGSGTDYVPLVDADGNLQVDVLSIVPGVAATSLGKAEDAAHTTGDVGVMALGVENEDQADLSTGDKDYTPIALTKEGNVIVKQEGTIAVTESSPISGFATSAAQLADGHNVTIDNISTNEVYIRGGGTAGSATDGEVVAVQGIASGTAMAVTESSPISGFATSALQLADGHNVTIDNAAAGAAVNIQDGGNTITVDGTVTAELSGTDNAVLDAIAASLEILDDWDDTNYANVNLNIAGTDVSANAGVLTAQTQRVTIATDDEVNNLLGTIDTDTGNIATYTQGAEAALEKIDGAIIGPGEPTIDSVTQFAINLNAGANQVLVSSAASKQIWVYAVAYTCSVAGTVSFQDEDDTAITGIMDHAANSGLAVGPSGNFSMPLWKLATNKDLEVDVVTAAIDGWITYAVVSV